MTTTNNNILLSAEMEALLDKATENHNNGKDTPFADEVVDEDDDDEKVNGDDDDEQKSLLSNFYQFCLTLYIPFLIQVLFGSFYIIRTLFLSYIVQYIVELFCVTEQAAIKFLGKGPVNTVPPALFGLALVTIILTIIHPDGFTWIILRKIRNGIMNLFQSSSTCWAIAVNDYGAVVSSLLALSTFAALFFFAYVLQKTLTPRTPPKSRQQSMSEKHKRKKRKNQQNRGRGRIRSTQSYRSQDDIATRSDGTETDYDGDKSQMLPPLEEDKPVVNPPEPVYDHSMFNMEIPVNEDKAEPMRDRLTSASTLDSTSSSIDDHSSIETASGRSTPTPAKANESNESVVEEIEKRAENSQSTVRSKTNNSKQNNNKGSSGNRRPQNARRKNKPEGGAHSSGHRPTSATATTPPPVVPSKRWDALKPTSRSSRNNRTHPYQKHHHPKQQHSGHRTYDSAGTTKHQKSIQSHNSASPLSVKSETEISHSTRSNFNLNNYSIPTLATEEKYLTRRQRETAQEETVLLTGFVPQNSQPDVKVHSTTIAAESPQCPSSSLMMTNTEIPVAAAEFGFLSQSTPDSWNSSYNATTQNPNISSVIRPPPGLINNFLTPRDTGIYNNNETTVVSPVPTSPFQNNSNNIMPLRCGYQDSVALSVPNTPTFQPTFSEIPADAPSVFQTLSLSPRTGEYHPELSAPPSLKYQRRGPKENPFASSSDDEDEIEAELQELGGRMVGSILDF